MKKLAILGTALVMVVGAFAFNSSSAGNHSISGSTDNFQQDTMHKRDTGWKHKKAPRDTTYKSKRKHDSTSVNH